MASLGTLMITIGVDDSRLRQSEKEMRRLGVTASKTARQINQSVHTWTAQVNNAAQRTRTLGYLAAAVVTAPMVAAAKQSIQLASQFEYNIQKMVGLVGVAQNEANEFAEELRTIGVNYGRGPQELSEALYYITSAGIRGAEALDVLEMSAKGAASGLGDTQKIANLVTSALNAYAGTGLTAAKVMDQLSAAVRVGKIETAGFANAVGQVIPIASEMGVTFDQVAGAMAAMSLTGSNAAKASTYLKGILNGLQTASAQGAEALHAAAAALGEAEIGYEDLRVILKEKGLIALLNEVNRLSEVYGDTLVKKVFPNIRAVTGILSIAGKNFEYNTKIMNEVADSAGSLNKAWNAVSDTMKIKLDRSLAAIQFSLVDLGKTAGTVLLPIIEKLVIKLTNLIDHFDDLTDTQKRHKIILAVITAAFGPFLLLLSTAQYLFTGLVKTGGHLVAMWVGLGRILTGTTAAQAANAAAAAAATTAEKGLAVSAGEAAVSIQIMGNSAGGATVKIVGLGEASAATAVANKALGKSAAAGAAGAGALGKGAGLAAGGVTTLGAALTGFVASTGVLLILGLIAAKIAQVRMEAKKLEKQLNTLEGADLVTLDVDIDLSMESDVIRDIDNRIKEIDTLEKEGLEKLENNIAQEIALREDQLRWAKNINAEYIRNSEEYQSTLAAIEEQENRARIAKEKQEQLYATGGMEVFAAEIRNQQSVINAANKQVNELRSALDDFYEEQFTKKWTFLEGLPEQIDALEERRGIVTDVLDEFTESMEEANAAIERANKIDEIWLKMTAGEQLIERLSKAFTQLGKEYDKNGELAKLYDSILNEYLQTVDVTDYRVQEVIKRYARLKLETDNLTKSTEALKEVFNSFNDALQLIDIRKRFGAPDLTEPEEKLSALEDLLEGVYENYEVFQAKLVEEMGVPGFFVAEGYVRSLQERVKDLSQEIENTKAWEELQDYLREVGGEIDKLNYRYEVLGEQMDIHRARVNTYTNAIQWLKENYDEQNDVIQELIKTYEALIDVESRYTVSKYQMARIKELDEWMAQLTRLTNEYYEMDEALRSSDAGKDLSEQWDKYIHAIIKAQNEQQNLIAGLQLVQSAAYQLGMIIGGQVEDAIVGMVDTVLRYVQSIVQAALMAAVALKFMTGAAIPGGLIWAAASVSLMLGLWNSQKSKIAKAAQMIEGGVVPPGYPNDTYPARLTSGEVVVPPGKLDNVLKGNQVLEGKVVFEIEGTKLKGILRKVESIGENY